MLSDNDQAYSVEAFNSTSRYILLNIYNRYFLQIISQLYYSQTSVK